MKILIACEESQRVCTEMRRLGHEAYSCDIEPCSGGHPEWHIQQDCIPLLNGRCEFDSCDGEHHVIRERWDMIIAHPPCTYLSNVCSRHYSLDHNNPENVIDRMEKREKAVIFFLIIAFSDCDRIAIENPVGHMNTVFRKPDQIVSPYMFAEDENDTENYHQKRTCFWLKGLNLLKATNNLPCPRPIRSYINSNGKKKNVTWEMCVSGRNKKEVAKNRSKTFPGIAKAMAEQWAGRS